MLRPVVTHHTVMPFYDAMGFSFIMTFVADRRFAEFLLMRYNAVRRFKHFHAGGATIIFREALGIGNTDDAYAK